MNEQYDKPELASEQLRLPIEVQVDVDVSGRIFEQSTDGMGSFATSTVESRLVLNGQVFRGTRELRARSSVITSEEKSTYPGDKPIELFRSVFEDVTQTTGSNAKYARREFEQTTERELSKSAFLGYVAGAGTLALGYISYKTGTEGGYENLSAEKPDLSGALFIASSLATFGYILAIAKRFAIRKPLSRKSSDNIKAASYADSDALRDLVRTDEVKRLVLESNPTEDKLEK